MRGLCSGCTGSACIGTQDPLTPALARRKREKQPCHMRWLWASSNPIVATAGGGLAVTDS